MAGVREKVNRSGFLMKRRALLLGIASIAVVILIWQAIAMFIVKNPFHLPTLAGGVTFWLSATTDFDRRRESVSQHSQSLPQKARPAWHCRLVK